MFWPWKERIDADKDTVAPNGILDCPSRMDRDEEFAVRAKRLILEYMKAV